MLAPWKCRRCSVVFADRPKDFDDCPVCGFKGPSETGATGRRNWYTNVASAGEVFR